MSKQNKDNEIIYIVSGFIGDYKNYINILFKFIKAIHLTKRSKLIRLKIWLESKEKDTINFTKNNKFVSNNVQFNLGLLKPSTKMKKDIVNSNFFMGDTDVFIDIGKNNRFCNFNYFINYFITINFIDNFHYSNS